MPIQIPTLKRNDAPEPESVGRVNTQAPNLAQPFEQATQSLAHGARMAIHAHDRADEDAGSLIAIDKATEYESRYREELDGNSEKGTLGVKNYQGDPTPVYNEFDTKMKDKFDELLNDGNTYSERTRFKISRALARAHNSVYGVRLTAYANQYARYEQGVTDDSVSLKQKGLSDAAGMINSADQNSTALFDQNVGDIQNIRIGSALKMGAAQLDPNGQYMYVDDTGKAQRANLSPGVKVQIAQDLSKGIYNAVDNLIKSNSFEQAKTLMDKYNDRIDPVNQKKLNEDYQKGEKKFTAYQTVQSVDGLPADKQLAAIDKIKDEETKDQALSYLDSKERHRADIRERSSTDTYNRLSIDVQKKMQSGEPYTSIDELESDPMFSRQIDKVTDAKQRKALYQLVDNPKESDEDAKRKFYDAIQNGELYGMTSQQLFSMQTGLNKEDRKVSESAWRTANTDTEAQERSRQTYVMSQIYKRAIGTGLINLDRQTGRLNRTDTRSINDLQTRVLSEVGKLPKGSSTQDITNYINSVVSEELINKNKKDEGWFSSFTNLFGGGNKTVVKPLDPVIPFKGGVRGTTAPQGAPAAPTVPSSTNSGIKSLSQGDRDKAAADFAKANGRAATNATELMDFYRKQNKK